MEPIDNSPGDYYKRILGVANNTGLGKFRISPFAYYDWANGAEEDETQGMHEGTAFHLALHEPEKFAKKYVVIPKMPLNSKDKKQEFLDVCFGFIDQEVKYDGKMSAEDLNKMVNRQLAEAGVYLLTDEFMGHMRGMVESLNRECHSYARGFVSRGLKEYEIRWVDPDSGIPCKAKVDSWDEPLAAESDLKRTDLITPRAFSRSVLDNGYAFQRAFYRRGLKAKGFEPRSSWFVCGQPRPPYHWAVYDLPEEVIEEADRLISLDLLSLRECMETKCFPTINNGEAVTLNIRPEFLRR